MPDRSSSNLVTQSTWKEVALRLERGAAAIVPVGAGAKQHGLHLPMGTDQAQAEWFAMWLAARIDALVWPTLTYGSYPAFTAYAGSVSLSDETFENVVLETVDGLVGYGARSVVILNTGLSAIAPIDRALARVQDPARARQIAIWTGPRCRRAIEQFRTQLHGSHADEAETSLMLAIAPHLVAMEKAEASPPLPGGVEPGPLTPTDTSSPNYSRSGSFGDPTLATLEKGRALEAAIQNDVIEAAEQILNQPAG